MARHVQAGAPATGGGLHLEIGAAQVNEIHGSVGVAIRVGRRDRARPTTGSADRESAITGTDRDSESGYRTAGHSRACVVADGVERPRQIARRDCGAGRRTCATAEGHIGQRGNARARQAGTARHGGAGH
jgi:hypothetical protein